jgi:hypothetical protein
MGLPKRDKDNLPLDVVKAESLRKHLKSRGATVRGVRAILCPRVPPRGWTAVSWKQAVEQKYNHGQGYGAVKQGGKTAWVSTGTQGLRNVVAESPLRRDLREAFKKAADELIRELERATPTTSASDVDAAAAVLSAAQRQQAIQVADNLKKAKRWPNAWAPCDVLARWLFHEKVWPILCRTGASDVQYYKAGELGGNVSAPLFRRPTGDEKNRWQQEGAEKFLRAIAANIDKQLLWFSEDIGWLASPSGLHMSGSAEAVLARVKTKIREYQKGWETLGNSTGTLSTIKREILNPAGGKSTYMKYLWSEEERKKLRGWGKAT